MKRQILQTASVYNLKSRNEKTPFSLEKRVCVSKGMEPVSWPLQRCLPRRKALGPLFVIVSWSLPLRGL